MAVTTPPCRISIPQPAADFDAAGWDMVRHRRPEAAILHLFGQVIDFDGEPLPDVTVELWHDGMDPEEGGYGAVRTDRFGGYRFRTLLPMGDGECAPHLDARLTPARGKVLATRLYLLDDPRNERDWNFAALGPSRQAAVMLDPIRRADGDVEAGFNFVL